jgi:hypothetical protein
MSTGMIIRLVLMGLVFLVWAGMMFSTLFTLRARAETRTGRALSGPRVFLQELGVWLRSPEDKSSRRTLFFLTFVLLVMSVQNAFASGS